MSRPALITGIGGQDGYYLHRHLAGRNVAVVGVTTSPPGLRRWFDRDDPGLSRLVRVERYDEETVGRLLEDVEPGYVFHLAAVSGSDMLHDLSRSTFEVNGFATTVWLDAIRRSGKPIRFFQALSSEIYGTPADAPQTEETPPNPANAYGVAKAYAGWMVRYFRERFSVHGSGGILYNHESVRRPPTYLTRKVSLGVARIHLGLERELRLGNLDARRDWSDARDFVEAFWLIANQETPGDYVVASGRLRTVRELCEAAFSHVGLDYREHVVTEARQMRLADSTGLVGDATKLRERTGWRPRGDILGLVRDMVDHDVRMLREGGTDDDGD